MLGSRISNASQNKFCSFSYAFEMGKITCWWRKAKQVLDYRIVNKITCSPEGGYRLTLRCINLDPQKQWTRLA